MYVQYIPCTVHTMYSTYHVQYIPCTVHTMYSTYHVQYIPCTVHTMYSTYHVQYIPCTVHTMYSTYHVQYIPCTVHTMYSTIQWILSIVETIETQLAVLYREVFLDLYTAQCGWDCRECPHYRGILYSECPL